MAEVRVMSTTACSDLTLRPVRQVLRPRSPHWSTPVMEVSALAKGSEGLAELVNGRQTGQDAARKARRRPASTIADVADTIELYERQMGAAGAIRQRREVQVRPFICMRMGCTHAARRLCTTYPGIPSMSEWL
jgi:hypothetical protein